jgi:hypothetical protein
MNSDFKDLLSIFNANKVRYLVIGGHAVMKYTEPRYTKDADIWVEPTPRNARAVLRSLQEFGAPLVGINQQDFTREGMVDQMGRPPARVDIPTSVQGLRFADAWRNRERTDFDGIPAHVPSRSDLILNKRAVGRPMDLIDATNLEASAGVMGKPSRRRKRPPTG